MRRSNRADEETDRFGRIIATVLGALVVVFLIVASAMAIPALRNYVMGPVFLITVGAALFSLGTALIWLILKARVDGGLQKFLILTGASAAGFVVSAILHNLFYGLSLITEQITVLRYTMEGLHIVFFIVAVPICFPLGFLAGAAGSLVLFIRGRKKG